MRSTPKTKTTTRYCVCVKPLTNLLVAVFIFNCFSVYAQCSFSIHTTNNCAPATLSIQGGNLPATIEWQKDGSTVTVVEASWKRMGATLAHSSDFLGSTDMFVHANGNVYIADAPRYRITKWTPGATTGIVVAGGNGPGLALNCLGSKLKIFVDSLETVYVSDYDNSRITKWPPGATTGILIAGISGVAGNSADKLNGPSGLYVDGTGTVYVADQLNHRVQKWPTGSGVGLTIAGGNGAGAGANQLSSPEDMWVDALANMYIVDKANNRIQHWPSGATSGTTIVSGLVTGSAIQILRDKPGNLYFINNNWHVHRLSAVTNTVQAIAGTYNLATVANDSSFLTGGFGMDNNGNLYVLDWYNYRLLKFPIATSLSTQVNATGVYTAVTKSFDGCSFTTSPFTITSAGGPTISINKPDGLLCSGNVETFIANVTNAGSTPLYQWRKNGVNVGLSAPSYSDSVVANGDVISCQVTNSLNACTHTDSISTIVATAPSASRIKASSNCLPSTISATINDDISYVAWHINGTKAGSSGAHWNDEEQIIINTPASASPPSPSDYYIKTYEIDKHGNIYVLDGHFPRVLKFAPGSSSFTVVAGHVNIGTTPDRLLSPQDIAVDTSGNLYVADDGTNRVLRFSGGSTTGTLVQSGVSPKALFYRNGWLYVASNSTVFKFMASGGSRSAVATGAEIYDVYVDQKENVYVCEMTANRVRKWLAGSGSAIIVAGGNGPGYANNQLNSPSFVFADEAGNVYVTRWNYDDVKLEYGEIMQWIPGANSGKVVTNGYCPKIDADGNLVYVREGKLKRRERSHVVAPFTFNSPGSVSVLSYSSANGCYSRSGTIELTNATAPSVVINASDNDVCEGTPITVSAFTTGAGASPSYLWTRNRTVISTTDTVLISNLKTGDTVALKVTSSTGSCYQEADTILKVRKAPSVALVNNSLAVPANIKINSNTVLTEVLWSLNGNAVDTTHTWKTNGIRVAGNGVAGNTAEQLNGVEGLHLEDDGVFYTTDYCCVKWWKVGNPTSYPINYTRYSDIYRYADSFYMTSRVLNRIERHSLRFVNRGIVAGTSNGASGNSDSTLNQPLQVVMDGQKNLYVADWLNFRVQKFNHNSRVATTVAGGIGWTGGTPANEVQPYGVLLDSSNALYISSANSVKRWQPGASIGTVIKNLNSPSFNTRGMSFDAAGNLYVAGTDGVIRISAKNNDTMYVAGRPGVGSTADRLNQAYRVKFDKHGHMFVADYANSRVQLFTADSSKSKIVSAGGLYKITATAFNGCTVSDSVIVYSARYTFVGPGTDWDVTTNWQNNLKPPANIPAGYYVFINPSAAECIVNGNITVKKGATLKIADGKALKVVGTLVAEE